MFLGVSERAEAHSRPDMTRASSSESVNSAITVDCSAAQSSSSTPPTSIGDSASVSSASTKLEVTLPAPEEASAGRSRRPRTGIGSYNVKVLSGTAVHAPRKYCVDGEEPAKQTRRRTISGDTLVGTLGLSNSSTETIQKDIGRLVREGIDAMDLQFSAKNPPKSRSQISLGDSSKKTVQQKDVARRKVTRSAGEKVESFTKKLSVLGKRGRQSFEKGLAKAKRELRNLADTNEYAGIETKPVLLEVWSNGKLLTEEPVKKKKKKIEEATVPDVAETKRADKKKPAGRREKIWLSKGLYAGQEKTDLDWWSTNHGKEKERLQDIAPYRPNGVLPMPMWHGQRLLQVGRDFKLPFDVCSPLPPGQPKPDEWRKTSSNRFVGEAAAMWKKFTLFDSFHSKCVCSPERGCDEDCQNRIMLYECDDTNCASGRERCTNRAFADLQERRRGGGKYRIGVEVIKTADRGYGVRSNRSFEPHQIIVEYTGEIITEDECDRRMNEDYKDNDCYYLMSFDQNMIIDATKGSIARFVNHSCKPNCRMVKWIVGGKPRMALFAGDRPITTGEELTYDYNFDPFSAKNVQQCRCGSDNCRGILGPRPKDQKVPKDSVKEAVKSGVKAGKRKLKELLGGDDDNTRSPKKRKTKNAKGVKRPIKSSSIKIAKGAAKVMKKKISTQLNNARKVVRPKRVVKKTTKAKLLEMYGKRQMKLSSRNSSLTLVKGGDSPQKGVRAGKKSKAKMAVRSVRKGKAKIAPRGIRGSTIRVVTGSEE